MMRLLLVNRGHPDLTHVRAVRARGFAHGLARLGHRVVLLTQALDDTGASPRQEHLTTLLDGHDWSRPFILPVVPDRSPILDSARAGRLPKPLRKAVLAASFLRGGGAYGDWSNASRPYWPTLARHFKPDAAWGTFGDSNTLTIAQGVARLAACPWVLDMKDPWDVFIPPPLVRIMARRFSDASGHTSLSDQHGREITRWFGVSSQTIYSGIDPILLPPVKAPPPHASPCLLMLGSLYSHAHFRQLMDGIGCWAATLPPPLRATAKLIYAGTEIAPLQDAARALPIALETPGWCDLARLRALAHDATALLYVLSPQALYQHKGLELAALDRPILCLPQEHEETIKLVRALGVPFRSCDTAEMVAEALADFHAAPHVPCADRNGLARFSWDAQSVRLETVFKRLCAVQTAETLPDGTI